MSFIMCRVRTDIISFYQICAGLKEITSRPVTKSIKAERRRIPVEKSGGGV